MNKFTDFLLLPYLEASIGSIFFEMCAVFFGILSVIFSLKANIWLYPIGIFSTSMYIYITFSAHLYGDMVINIYYTLMSFYGWFIWKKNKGKNKEITVCFSTLKDYFYTIILFIFSISFTFIIYKYNDRLKESYIWADMPTTGIFFSAMYQMAKRKIENWIFWLIGNLISIPLYFYKGLALTSLQFIIFTFLSIRGYYSWKERLKNKT